MMRPCQVSAHLCNVSECILKWFNREKLASCCVTAQCGCPKSVDSSPQYRDAGIQALSFHGSATWCLGIHSLQAKEETVRRIVQGRYTRHERSPISCLFVHIPLARVQSPGHTNLQRHLGDVGQLCAQKRREWFLMTFPDLSTLLSTWDITVNVAQPLSSGSHTAVEGRVESVDLCRASWCWDRRRTGCFERQEEGPHSVLGCY